MKSVIKLNKFEKGLWSFSMLTVFISSILNNNIDYLTIIASLIGVTALIFVAKGYTIGQILTVLFSVLYAIISYGYHYYGEMITYVAMTGPIALLSVISWLNNPYDDNEVKVEELSLTKRILLLSTTIIVTVIFYYILDYFHTNNLLISTLSIATSFMASSLMLFRSPSYALAYGLNDIILIILWTLASLNNPMYYSMVICFIIFFINDMYGYYNWNKMKEEQR